MDEERGMKIGAGRAGMGSAAAGPSRIRKPARRTQQERRDTTRARLMASAIDCLEELGFAGTTLAEVADRAQVTIGAVQHHFGTRNDLFVAVTADIAERLLADAGGGSMERLSVRERIQLACDHYWKFVGSRDYAATLQIILGAGHNRVLNARILPIMTMAQKTLDQRWGEIFADQGIPAAKISTARHVALATFRGLAIRQLVGPVEGGWSREREMLVAMLELVLTAD